MSITAQIDKKIEVMKTALQQEEFKKQQAEKLRKLAAKAEKDAVDLETEQLLVEKALHLIVEAGDMVAQDSYRFVMRSVNSLLEKMFTDCQRTVRLTQKMSGKNPQLAVEVVADGVTRDLAESSGHGIAQVVSLICVICLIVLNNSRRIVVLDEVLSGISEQNKVALGEALWAFTESAGFQFIVCEHNFVPEGARVYNFVNNDGVSTVDSVYIQGEQSM